jgi:hypothetical protein
MSTNPNPTPPTYSQILADIQEIQTLIQEDEAIVDSAGYQELEQYALAQGWSAAHFLNAVQNAYPQIASIQSQIAALQSQIEEAFPDMKGLDQTLDESLNDFNSDLLQPYNNISEDQLNQFYSAVATAETAEAGTIQNPNGSMPTDPLQAALWAVENEFSTVEASIQAEIALGKAVLAIEGTSEYQMIEELAQMYPDDFANNPLLDQVAAMKAQISAIQAKVEAKFPDFEGMDQALNAILNASDQLTDQDVSSSDYQNDMQVLQKTFAAIATALQEQVQSDEDAAILQAASNVNDSADASAASQAIFNAAQNAVLSQTQEAADLSNLQDDLQAAFNGYQAAYRNADDDLSGVHWWNEWFGDGYEEEAEDHAIMRNAVAMEKILAAIDGAISGELAGLTPDFVQLTQQLNNLIKQILAILGNKDLSTGAKNAQILQLVMGALTLLGDVLEETAMAKAKMDQEMAKSSENSAEQGVQNVLSDEVKLDNARKYASIMGIFLKVATIVMGTVMTLMAPGAGSAFAMGLITILEGTGVMDQLTNVLASKVGSTILAQVLTAAIEIVATIGTGAIFDNAASVAADAAEDAVEIAVEDAVDDAVASAVKDAIENAGADVADAVARDASTELLETSLTSVAKQATRKAVQMYMRQNIVALISSLAKSASKEGLQKTILKAAEESIVESVQAAVKQAADKLIPFAEKRALGAALSEVEEEEVAAIAEKAANEGVASTFKTTGEKVAKETASNWKSWQRLGSSLAFSVGSSNLLVNLAEAIQKARGKGEDASFEQFLTFLQVFQQILSMAAMLFESGAVSAFSKDSATGSLQSLGNLLMAASTGVSMVGTYGQYEANSLRKEVVVELAKNNALLDIITFLKDQKSKEASQEQTKQADEITDQLKSTQQLAGHLFDGQNAAAKTLLAQAM